MKPILLAALALFVAADGAQAAPAARDPKTAVTAHPVQTVPPSNDGPPPGFSDQSLGRLPSTPGPNPQPPPTRLPTVGARPPSGEIELDPLQPPPAGDQPPGKGHISRGPMTIGKCRASHVEVNYDLDMVMGDPMGGAEFSWTGDAGCQLPFATAIWLKVVNGNSSGWVRIQPAGAPKAGGPPAHGSTGGFWGGFVCAFTGTLPRDCLPPHGAQSVYLGGHVADFAISWPATP